MSEPEQSPAMAAYLALDALTTPTALGYVHEKDEPLLAAMDVIWLRLTTAERAQLDKREGP